MESTPLCPFFIVWEPGCPEEPGIWDGGKGGENGEDGLKTQRVPKAPTTAMVFAQPRPRCAAG